MCTAELELVLKQVISHRMHILRDRSFLVIDLIYILMNVSNQVIKHAPLKSSTRLLLWSYPLPYTNGGVHNFPLITKKQEQNVPCAPQKVLVSAAARNVTHDIVTGWGLGSDLSKTNRLVFRKSVSTAQSHVLNVVEPPQPPLITLKCTTKKRVRRKVAQPTWSLQGETQRPLLAALVKHEPSYRGF